MALQTLQSCLGLVEDGAGVDCYAELDGHHVVVLGSCCVYLGAGYAHLAMSDNVSFLDTAILCNLDGGVCTLHGLYEAVSFHGDKAHFVVCLGNGDSLQQVELLAY